MTPLDYIRIDADVLCRKDLTDKAKMLLGLIQSFNGKGLMMSNPELAKSLGTSTKTISRAISELESKDLVSITGGQSRYRKIYWDKNGKVHLDKNGKVDASTGTKMDSTGTNMTPTFPKMSNITKGTKGTEYSFTLRNGCQWGLTVEKLSEYETTFPDIDLHRELRKARQWLIDNPDRRKTAKGMPRFLFGWLGACKPTPAEPNEYIEDAESVETILKDAGLC